MRKTFTLVTIVLTVFLSCQEKVKEEVTETAVKVEDAVIVHEEYTKPEPTEPEDTEYYEPKVPFVGPATGGKIPSDAIVLFDGTSLEHWVSAKDSTSAAPWRLNKDGSMTVADKTGDILTKQQFGDMQLHIEWRSPLPVQRDNQNRGNSGIFLNGLYEIQVLDQNDNPTYVNGQVGSIYKQGPPLAMASVPTGDWNTYDIIYHMPEFNADGGKTKSATVTVLHNGVLIQNHTAIQGTTPYKGRGVYEPHGAAPIRLQDHGNPMSFRNIWLRRM